MNVVTVVAAAVTLTSCLTSSSADGAECPCSPNNGNASFFVCSNTSLKSIPDCVPSNTVALSIRTPSIPLFPKSIRRFTNLQRLHIEYFDDPQLSKVFLGGQKNLVLFQIYETSLDYIDKEWFKYAPSIKTLVIAGNKIRSLPPDVFSYLPNLESLSLYRNELATLSTTIFEGIKLKVIYYHDNPWQCDCELGNFMQWLRDKKVTIRDKAYCAHPMQLEGINLKDLTPAVACTK